MGTSVLNQLLKKEHDIWVLIKDTHNLEEYQHKSMHAMSGDASENGSWLGQLPQQLDIVINLIPPQVPARLSLNQAENEIATNMFNIGKNLLYAATRCQAKRFYQISDVHCYNNTGTVISEKSPLDRDSQNWGRLYMELIPYLQSQHNLKVTLFMHGLLYNSSGSTTPKIPLLAGKLPVVGNGSNLISLTHEEDLSSALVFALEKEFDQPVLNIVDDKPILQKEFIDLLSLRRNCSSFTVPAFLARPLIGEVLANTLCESIQVNNSELKSLGYWLKFPDIKAGLAAGAI